jgi:hypothetical protein
MGQHAEHVIIGVDPHQLSATIEVVDQHEQLLGSDRFTTDRAGHTAMRGYAKARPNRRGRSLSSSAPVPDAAGRQSEGRSH